MYVLYVTIQTYIGTYTNHYFHPCVQIVRLSYFCIIIKNISGELTILEVTRKLIGFLCKNFTRWKTYLYSIYLYKHSIVPSSRQFCVHVRRRQEHITFYFHHLYVCDISGSFILYLFIDLFTLLNSFKCDTM